MARRAQHAEEQPLPPNASVILSPEALGDLETLYDHIAADSGAFRAIGYIARIEAFCH